MGVNGLWPLLERFGHPISLEDLMGQVIAVDGHLWIHQFKAAMRTATGESVRESAGLP